jgi:hypothetical protein
MARQEPDLTKSDPSRAPLRVVIAVATVATSVVAGVALLLVGTPCDSGGQGGCNRLLALAVLLWAVAAVALVRVGHWYWRAGQYREAARYTYMGIAVSLAWCLVAVLG